MGIMIQPGSRKALIRTAGAPEGTWFAERAKFDGWTLSAIDDDSIVVRSGEIEKVLQLYSGAGPKPAS